jgi:hypothetical protein
VFNRWSDGHHERISIRASYRRQTFRVCPKSKCHHTRVTRLCIHTRGYLCKSHGNTLICVTSYPGGMGGPRSSRAWHSPSGLPNMSGDALRSVITSARKWVDTLHTSFALPLQSLPRLLMPDLDNRLNWIFVAVTASNKSFQKDVNFTHVRSSVHPHQM